MPARPSRPPVPPNAPRGLQMITEADAQPQDPLIGHIISEYRIERVLGQGGMGVVYLARHLKLDRLVALKTLAPRAARAPAARERFQREALALARVKAAGLVDILAVGEAPAGMPYIVMEYLEGQTLRQRLQQTAAGWLALEPALALTEQLATTLCQLHAKGVVHRDIKPENIMLVADAAVPGGERTKILDLGIAKLLEETSTLTQTEQPGTVLYMAPEACQGLRNNDGQVDIYSLGCVLYELLCARPPFTATDGSSVVFKQVQQRPERLRRYRPDLPPAVESFVLELLAKDPAARPQAAEVVARLQSLRRNPHQSRMPRLIRFRLSGMGIALRKRMPLLLVLAALLISVGVLPLRKGCQSGAVQIPAGNMDMSSSPERRQAAQGPAPQLEQQGKTDSMIQIPAGRVETGSSLEQRKEAQALAQRLDKREGKDGKYLTILNTTLAREEGGQQVQIPELLFDKYEVSNDSFAKFLTTKKRLNYIEITACRGNKSYENFQCAYDKQNNPYKTFYGNKSTYGGILYSDGEITVAPHLKDAPVVAVSWHAANMYCQDRGGRLPTGAEWEYVASSGKQFRFPWGNADPVCQSAIMERRVLGEKDPRGNSDPAQKVFDRCNPDKVPQNLLPVDHHSQDRSHWGVFGLGGSVQEWTADEFKLPGKGGGSETTHRVIKGGAWNQDFLAARPAARFQASADAMMSGVGFRCVQDLPRP